MPVILTVDGPSLGGFVCAATIVSSELWKVGQVRPSDEIRFKQITIDQAYAAAFRTDALVAAVRGLARGVVEAAKAQEELDNFDVSRSLFWGGALFGRGCKGAVGGFRQFMAALWAGGALGADVGPERPCAAALIRRTLDPLRPRSTPP